MNQEFIDKVAFIENLAINYQTWHSDRMDAINELQKNFIKGLNEKITSLIGEKFIFSISGGYNLEYHYGPAYDRKKMLKFDVFYAGTLAGPIEIKSYGSARSGSIKNYLLPSNNLYLFSGFSVVGEKFSTLTAAKNPVYLEVFERQAPSWSLWDIVKQFLKVETVRIMQPSNPNKDREIKSVLKIGNAECKEFKKEKELSIENQHFLNVIGS